MLKKISYMTAGESHGKGLIGIIEGIPAGMNITEDDLYIVGNKLFVNQDGEIYIYSFPMNEYFEAIDSFFNMSSLPFKQYVDLMLNRTIN